MDNSGKRSTDGAAPRDGPGGMLSVLREHAIARIMLTEYREHATPRPQIRAPSGENVYQSWGNRPSFIPHRPSLTP